MSHTHTSNLRPLADRVLLKRHSQEAKSPGGIIIPENAREKQTTATVRAVGPGRFEHGRLIEPHVKSGDTVIVGKYGGQEVKVDDEDLVIVREEDILGVVDTWMVRARCYRGRMTINVSLGGTEHVFSPKEARQLRRELGAALVAVRFAREVLDDAGSKTNGGGG